ncbi:hypothetical protein [Chitinophaga flava]|uniref:Uncharacterized protein n=1 Tax=Chitinophaga flava TaxID=2259036 RepID=A0A365Y3A8_9BACT|nr:hypothetical protein [Chitinophaga flava]RBL93062.1 hypothetical protein DF182_10965 [Chitinophaga flava]
MRRDYIVEIFEELGKILAAVVLLKKTQPGKALDQINTAFKGTKFGDRAAFDSLSTEAFPDFLEQRQMGYETAEVIVDLLLEEVEIRLAMGDVEPLPALLEKTRLLMDYAVQKETALKIFSLKHDQQSARLKDLSGKII